MRSGSPFPSLGAVALLVAGLALLLAGGGDGSPDRAGRDVPDPVTTRVAAVIDGDTIEVELGGRPERVRYIGVDTPESAVPGERPECGGKRAARRNRRLVGGRRVTLVPGAERRDDYGRLLAYVYRAGNLGERRKARKHVRPPGKAGIFVNAALVRGGYARTLAIAPNTDFAARFARLEQRAANAGRGLWGNC